MNFTALIENNYQKHLDVYLQFLRLMPFRQYFAKIITPTRILFSIPLFSSPAIERRNPSPTRKKPSNLLKPTGRRSAKTRNGRLARSSFSCSRTRFASRSALIRPSLASFFSPSAPLALLHSVRILKRRRRA